MKNIGLEALDGLFDHDFEGLAVLLELTLGEVRPDCRSIRHHVAHSHDRERKLWCFEADREEMGKVGLVVRPQPHDCGYLMPLLSSLFQESPKVEAGTGIVGLLG
jgi:hypothetical protein